MNALKEQQEMIDSMLKSLAEKRITLDFYNGWLQGVSQGILLARKVYREE